MRRAGLWLAPPCTTPAPCVTWWAWLAAGGGAGGDTRRTSRDGGGCVPRQTGATSDTRIITLNWTPHFDKPKPDTTTLRRLGGRDREGVQVEIVIVPIESVLHLHPTPTKVLFAQLEDYQFDIFPKRIHIKDFKASRGGELA